jgi:predicted alpha/beta superfamily hydrolase
MDIGSAETSDDLRADFPQVYLNGARRMSNLLAQKPEHIALHYLEEEGAVHNETAWARRFPEMVRFFESASKRIL